MPNKNKQLDIEGIATSLVRGEVTDWEDSVVFVTEKVAFNIRNLIRQCRKNYWGVFDKPQDPTTGRDKFWVPLTEYLTEASVKSIDIDSKDLTFRARRSNKVRLAGLVRQITKIELDRMNFGEDLDLLERSVSIDGTAVWKTIQQKNEPKCKIIPVDLLNFYIDPQAKSISETPAVIERAVIDISAFQAMNLPMNTSIVTGSENIDATDGERQFASKNTRGSTKFVEVFERWGLMEESLLTGKKEDVKLVEGHIICSRKGSAWYLHLVEKNIKGKKPYEEAWYTRVPGRWYGRGVPERLLMLQTWINTIVNIRINRSYLSQAGIFKIKRNAGITSSMISRMPANGAITVNNMDDVEQMAMQEASQASYTDESNIMSWGRNVTSAYETVTGEGLPSNTTATNGAIQARSAQSQFVLIREGLGNFLCRWVRNQYFPILSKMVTPGYIFRLGLEDDVKEQIVNNILVGEIEKANSAGMLFDPMQAESEKARLVELMKNETYVRLSEDLKIDDYDVQISVTNENGDVGVISQNLIQMLQLAPEYKDQIIAEVADLLGVGPFKKSPEAFNPEMIGQMMGQQIPQMQPINSMSQQPVTQANTAMETVQ